MNEKKDDVLSTLKLAKELNFCENIGYGFTCEDIDEILECLNNCNNRQLIDTLNKTKEILTECLKQNPDKGTVTRIGLKNVLIEKVIEELN